MRFNFVAGAALCCVLVAACGGNSTPVTAEIKTAANTQAMNAMTASSQNAKPTIRTSHRSTVAVMGDSLNVARRRASQGITTSE